LPNFNFTFFDLIK